VTPNLGFKVTVYLQVEYLKNGAFYGQNYYRTLNRKPYTVYQMVPHFDDLE